MRRTLIGTIITFLGLTAALGWLSPAATQAAPAAAFGSDTITGTLVATPQTTLPATLLIQSGDRTVSVVVTADTQVEDSAGNALSLTLLSDGDNLRVTTIANRQGGRGRGQSTAIDATVVQDLSQPISPTQPTSPTSLVVTGTLAGEFTNGLCLQNAGVTNGGISPSAVTANPCPTGDVAVYLASGATIENAGGTVITITSLLLNDSLQAMGTVTNGQFTATMVQDLTQSAAPMPTTYQLVVTGTLAAEFANGLCLQNISVTNGAVSPATGAASPCPSGDLPVYLAGGATIENNAGTAIVVTSLLLNDSLQATGTVNNGQFSASVVQDLSQATAPVPTAYQLVATGTLAGEFTNGLCLQNTSVTNGAISPAAVTASPCPSGDLPVYLASGATFENAGGRRLPSTHCC